MGPNSYYGGSVDNSYQTPNNKQSLLKSKRGLLIVVLAIMIVLTIILGVVSSMSGSTSDKFMRYTFSDFNAEKSYSLLSEEYKNGITLEFWAEKVKYYKDSFVTYTPTTENQYAVGGEVVTEYRYNLTPTESYGNYDTKLLVSLRKIDGKELVNDLVFDRTERK